MAARFVIQKKQSGQYHFVLRAANGEFIATSENYTSKLAAQKGIDSVKTNARGARIDETGES